MFNQTKLVIDKIIKLGHYIAWSLNYGMSAIMMLYLSVAIAISFGNTIANTILLPITTTILVLTIIANSIDKKTTKNKIKITKKILKWVKLVVNAYSLGITLYGMFVASTLVSPISIIINTLLLLFWLVKVIIEIVIDIGEYYIGLLKESLHNDFKWAYEPKNFVSEKAEMVKEGLGEAKVKAQETIVVVKESSKEWGTKIKNYFKKEEVEEVVATEEE